MIVWLDNHLSPALARLIETEFGHTCMQVRDLGLARASDSEIFGRARSVGAVLLTKDRDFAGLVDRRGAPPAIVLLTIGNTSTPHLKIVLRQHLGAALTMIDQGEALVEIGGAP